MISLFSHTGTAHGQWLDDIAAQIQEEERLIREQQNEQAAEFFSYDRLGSSLPVDYQKKVRLLFV